MGTISAILAAVWAWLTTGTGFWGVGGLAALVLGYLLKKYFTDEALDFIGDAVEKLFFVLFSMVTVVGNKIPGSVWEKLIEEPLQQILKVVWIRASIGTQRGLDHDDEIGGTDSG